MGKIPPRRRRRWGGRNIRMDNVGGWIATGADRVHTHTRARARAHAHRQQHIASSRRSTLNRPDVHCKELPKPPRHTCTIHGCSLCISDAKDRNPTDLLFAVNTADIYSGNICQVLTKQHPTAKGLSGSRFVKTEADRSVGQKNKCPRLTTTALTLGVWVGPLYLRAECAERTNGSLSLYLTLSFDTA